MLAIGGEGNTDSSRQEPRKYVLERCSMRQCNKTCAIQLILRWFLVTYYYRQITLPLDRRVTIVDGCCDNEWMAVTVRVSMPMTMYVTRWM